MFKIISDSGCDFSNEDAIKHDIGIVPFYVSFGQDYLREGIDISKEDYFKRLVVEKDLFPKTSQPNPQDFIDIYTPYLEDEKDILCLTISSKLSGTHTSAVLAANMLKEQYPNRTITLVDSLNASIGQGLILREIIRMRDAGYSLHETEELAQKIIKTAKIYFVLDSLEYLKKGGRLGPTTALVGGLLGLRPILQLEAGEISQLDSIRGKKNVLRLIQEGMVEALKDDTENINLGIGHILSVKDAASFKTNIEVALGMEIMTPITEVGAAIGAHAGPGALAFSYCKKYDTL